jgi:hypothetical protein
MSSQTPQVGQFSPDGQFQWDGREWMPVARGHREPTPWTRPMQLVTAGFFALGVLNSVVSAALFLRADTIMSATRAQNPSLSEDTVRQAANVGVAIGWTTVIVISLVVLLLAVGSLLRWRWVFWVNLVWLALSSIGVITNLVSLAANPATQQMPRGSAALSFVLSLAALALLIWYIVALARYGPWAMRKPGA